MNNVTAARFLASEVRAKCELWDEQVERSEESPDTAPPDIDVTTMLRSLPAWLAQIAHGVELLADELESKRT